MRNPIGGDELNGLKSSVKQIRTKALVNNSYHKESWLANIDGDFTQAPLEYAVGSLSLR